MLGSRIFAGAEEKLPISSSGKLDAETFSWSMIWKVRQRNMWQGIATFSNETPRQFYQVAMPCMDDHQLIEEENDSVAEFMTRRSPTILSRGIHVGNTAHHCRFGFSGLDFAGAL